MVGNPLKIVAFNKKTTMKKAFKISVLMLFMVFSLPLLNAQNFNLVCLEVQPDGSVKATWTNPTGLPPGTVINYFRLFRVDPLTGAQSSIGGPLVGMNMQTDASVNANNQSYTYQVLVEYLEPGATTPTLSVSNELSTIHLTATAQTDLSGNQNGYASLNWNEPTQNYDPFIIKAPYNIARDLYSNTGFMPVAYSYQSTLLGVTSFDDPDLLTANACSDSAIYQIVVGSDAAATLGCAISSNVAGVTVSDYSPPQPPDPQYVSIDPVTNEIYFEWQNSNPIPEIDGFGFFVNNSGCTGVIADETLTTFGPFSNPSFDPQLGPISLAMMSYDYCTPQPDPVTGVPPSGVCVNPARNESNGSYIVKSSHLQATNLDCEKSIRLDWTLLDGAPLTVSEYRVYLDIDNSGAYTQIATVDADSLPQFTYENVDYNTIYCFYVSHVRASDGLEITSNSSCIQTPIITPPSHLYLNCVSVIDAGRVQVSFNVPPYPSLNNGINYGFSIKRSTLPDTNFTEIGRIGTIDFQEDYQFVDPNVKTGELIHYYTVEALDACLDPVAFSDTVSTILLKGQNNADVFTNTLIWNRYQGYNYAGSGVDFYDLYRTIQSERDYELHKTFFSNEFTFIDDYYDLLDIDGKICYYIGAVETSGTNTILDPTKPDTCYSNELCIPLKEIVWIPTAFSPDNDNLNDAFAPVVSFIKKDSYLLEIFDRWGNKVYRSVDVDEKFEGKYTRNDINNNGDDCPAGIYIYQFSFKNGKGQLITTNGHVALVR